MGQYTDPQTSPATIADRFSAIIGGKPQLTADKRDIIIIGGLNPYNDSTTKGKLAYVEDCARLLQNNTQQEMVSLFTKLGMTYIPQTKPFWEVDSTLLSDSSKSIGKWTESLYK